MAELVEPHELMFNKFEPKVKNRFIMYVDGIPAYLIRKMNRPAINNNEVVLKHMNVERYIKGRSQWEAISGIELYDPVVNSFVAPVTFVILLYPVLMSALIDCPLRS